ncbi:hypothetical protein BDB00DRAFT_940318 [Zychaea mexicana]|uniref:uncharacterized protein n=1 Tax=Zychaea mexicana TaxID=64656 RepID=UPI0022FDE89F|nr:uncharacterized protein BDB00DRAFT_940318 [Zychaea mexicana]KAI9491389.1 hypothetical protein BDB00DRAFT_940318 [Zychaea mexicana]
MYRAVPIKLTKIIRKDLPVGDKTHARNLLASTAKSVSNNIQQLDVLVRALMLDFAAGWGDIGKDGLSVVDLVPKNVQREQRFVKAIGHYFPVATIKQLKDQSHGKDIFSQTHIQHIQSVYLANDYKEHKNNPWKLWDQQAIRPIATNTFSRSPPGMSQSLSVAAQNFAKNLKQMYADGKRFKYALHKLILQLCRFNLAPDREARYIKYRTVFSTKKKERRQKIKKRPNRSLLHKFSSTQKKLQQSINKESDPGRRLALQKRLCANIKHSRVVFDRYQQQKEAYKIQKRNQATTADKVTEEQMIPSKTESALNLGLPGEEEVGGEDADSDDDWEEDETEGSGSRAMNQSTNEHQPKKIKIEKDLPTRRVNRIKSMLVAILLDDKTYSQNDIIKNWERFTIEDDLTFYEVQWIMKVYGLLKPYIPAKGNRFTIIYQLSIIIITNIVLRLSSYSSFTRAISPVRSSGKIGALHVSAATLYESLGVRENGFSLYTKAGVYFTSFTEATSRKAEMFGSVFDIDHVRDICDSRGLDFNYTIILNNDTYCTVIGTLQPSTVPTVSAYDVRKKRNCLQADAFIALEASQIPEADQYLKQLTMISQHAVGSRN